MDGIGDGCCWRAVSVAGCDVVGGDVCAEVDGERVAGCVEIAVGDDARKLMMVGWAVVMVMKGLGWSELPKDLVM